MSIKLEVLKWEDRSGGKEIVHRVPEQGMADLKLGARVIVQESQAAVFFRNGAAMDVFKPGAHTLSTENVPLISKLYNLVYQEAPFQSAVYFVSLKPFRELKWGTKEPIMLEDAALGYAPVRAFGTFSIRITDPQVFINTVVGTEGRQDSHDVERWFKEVTTARFGDLLAEYMEGKSWTKLQRMKDELGVATKARTGDDFAKYGLELYEFFVSSISVPEELTKAMMQRGQMQALGLTPGGQGFMQMAAADAMRDAAKNPGGAGGPMSAGLGMGMGMMMPGMMAGSMFPGGQQGGFGGGYPQQGGYHQGGPAAAAPPPLPSARTFHAVVGGAQQGPFDANALNGLKSQGQITPATLVWSQGMSGWTPAKDVPELAALFAPSGPPPIPGAGPPPLPA